jgi:hypothetical protein
LKATQFKEGLTPCLIDQGEAAKILKVDKVSIFRFAESKQLDRHYIPSPTGGRNIVRFRLEQVLSLAGFSDTEINKIVSERLNK